MRKMNCVILILGLIFTLFLVGCEDTDRPQESNQSTEGNLPIESNSPNKSDQADYNSAFDFNTKAVMLNSGYEMPIIGLGTWTLDDETAENSVYHALKDGYRLIDTAKYYGNEKGVGNGVRRAVSEGLVTREEVFITTKIVPYGFDDYDLIIDECNENLGLDYIDLVLIHQRGEDEKELYKAIEKAIDRGVVRSLGISNYYTSEEFDEITKDTKILPTVIQNENHIFFQNTEFQNYIKQYGTIIESYYPFGGRGHTADSMNNDTIVKIAETYGKTGAQVILRWQLQAGYIAIPGSSNPEHIAENFDIFDFQLSDNEMQEITALNTGKRYENW